MGASMRERSQRRGHALASTKFQPDGKHVSEDREKRGQAGQQVVAGIRSARVKRHRGQPFERVKNQRQQTQGRRRARHVGGADVAAAGQPDILSAKNAHQNEAEGNRSQKIAEGGGEKNTHRFCSAGVPSAVGWASRPPVVTAIASSLAAIASSLVAAGEDARRTAGGTPALLQSKACNLGVPRAAPHRLALVQEELTGGHRTKLERPHRGQFLLQALKHRVRAVALDAGEARRSRRDAAKVRCGLNACSSLGTPSAAVASSTDFARVASCGPAAMPIQKTRGAFAVGKNP